MLPFQLATLLVVSRHRTVDAGEKPVNTHNFDNNFESV
jgi:hypothetical protein